MPSINDLKKIAEIEYAGIVKNTLILDYKLRIILVNNSFIDINLSRKLPEKFGFHWNEWIKQAQSSDMTIFPIKTGKISLHTHTTFIRDRKML